MICVVHILLKYNFMSKSVYILFCCLQVVIGCFLPGQELKAPIQAEPLAAAPPRVNHGVSAGGSPASRGTLSESSGGGPGSPLNQSTGAYNNSNNAQGMTAFPWK